LDNLDVLGDYPVIRLPLPIVEKLPVVLGSESIDSGEVAVLLTGECSASDSSENSVANVPSVAHGVALLCFVPCKVVLSQCPQVDREHLVIMSEVQEELLSTMLVVMFDEPGSRWFVVLPDSVVFILVTRIVVVVDWYRYRDHLVGWWIVDVLPSIGLPSVIEREVIQAKNEKSNQCKDREDPEHAAAAGSAGLLLFPFLFDHDVVGAGALGLDVYGPGLGHRPLGRACGSRRCLSDWGPVLGITCAA